ncbi:MAG: IS200/IS605 family transposase [Anaerolineales bacterium]|nr:IS200/IS605 family transposase [Anaerolineales bacterium]
MLRKTLEPGGAFRVHVVHTKSEAIVRADEENCSLVFLDLELGEYRATEIGQSLRTIRPNIDLFILCDNETPPALDAIRPWTLIRKPFYLPDVLNLLANPQASQAESQPTLAWLSDPTKAAQHLTRITLGSSAQAALITRKNDLWAYAGGLSQAAAKEVAQTVTRNWDGQKGSDLLRFIRLESTKAEHMLYATRLATDVVLAMVFDAETPFSTIRSQASQLVTSLEEEKTNSQKNKLASKVKQELPVEQIEEMDDDDDGLEVPQISNILSDIPSPNPKNASHPHRSLPRQPEPLSSPGQTRQSAPLSRTSVFSREASPPVPLRELLVPNQQASLDQAASPQATLDGIDVTAPSKPRTRPETPVKQPEPGEVAETRPSRVTEAARSLKLEPITAGLYHLTYACLLVPRFTSHYLTGDLADHMSEWLPSICIAFGWRLEHLSVRPEYLQWVVNVQPNTSPGQLMRLMRQQTSEKIFTEFPRLKKENPSGDFWAPGYLIMGGNQPHPSQLVKDYIRETRDRQGQENSKNR